MLTFFDTFSPKHIPSSLKHLAARTAIVLFRATRSLKRRVQAAGHAFGRALLPISRIVVRLAILPAYRTIVFLRLKFRRLLVPTRSSALFLVGNKYLFHLILGATAVSTVLLNIRTQQVYAQDIGKNSLLYALATNSDSEIVQEEARTEAGPSQKYVTDALVAVPHVDFDYTETEEATVASLSVPGTIPASIALDTTAAPRAPRTKTETYVVQAGDTIGSIAEHFSVNVGTVLWNNTLRESEYIRPGDTLRIPPVSGMIVTVKRGDTISKLAARYGGDKNDILSFNHISDESSIAPGTDLVIPDGKPPAPAETIIAVRVQARERANADRSGVSFAARLPKPADAATASLPSAKLLWPTSGHVITQYYGWKHTGVDIDGDFTSPLYAAYDGVVTTAGWNNGGYGLQVVIQHPNGMTTRYGHSSKLFVKVGDEVKRGQVLAMMGSTGRSTGSHLHFEVYVNGKRTNPLAYIK